jgi:hypothetical protein
LKLSEEQLQLFDNIIRNFRITLKNCVFYEPNHPLYVFSIKNFKTALDKWLLINNKIDIGFSQDNLFLNGAVIKEKDDGYSEIANYLHIRGVMSLAISKGIEKKELTEFFNFIRNDRKTIRGKGGILKNISIKNKLEIKEIDYSALLVSTKERSSSDEKKMWQFLFNIVEESKGGQLPDSKVEFMVNFFKDTNKSVKTLNKVYKEAVAQLQDEDASKDIRKVIQQICQYFEEYSSEEARDLKVKLMNVISQLHPDLISILFEQTVGSENDFDLAETITKDFSENYIAEFIESLISNEDTFNENLLKVFDKLAPGAGKSDNVVLMVADKLFSKRIVDPNTLSKLQMSIKEIFKRHPNSNFMNQIYNITVDAVVNKKIDTLIYVARLSPLINKFVQSIEEEQLKKEKIWLLLNILWLENDATEFKKFSEKLVSVLPELLDSKDTDRIKDIIEFFTEKIRPEQKNDKNMIQEIKEGLNKITNPDTMKNIILLIPESSKSELENIAYTLIKSTINVAKLLLDAFIMDKNPAHRNKFIFVFHKMKTQISKEIINRLEYSPPHIIRDLFHVLKECDSKKAHLVAKKLMRHKSAQIRWEALEKFEPWTGNEIYAVFLIYKKEKNHEVKKKAAIVLLKTKNTEIIDSLFKYTKMNIFNRKFLIKIVELCGHLRVQESYEHLRKIFLKKTFINTKRKDELRVAALSSLARLESKESMKLVKDGSRDRSKRVREMSEILMKLNE